MPRNEGLAPSAGTISPLGAGSWDDGVQGSKVLGLCNPDRQAQCQNKPKQIR